MKDIIIHQADWNEERTRISECADPGDVPEGTPLFLAKYQGQPTGYAFLTGTEKRVPWAFVRVKPAYWGLHIGRELLIFATDYARKQGHGAVMLSADPMDVRAQVMAERAGYRWAGHMENGDVLFSIRFKHMRADEKPYSPPIKDEVRTIRPLVPGDAALAEEFFAQMGAESRAYFNRGNWNLTNLRRYLEGDDAGGAYWMSRRTMDGAMDGYVFLKNITTGIPTLGIAVRDDAKGLGLGSRLIRHAISYAKVSGAGGIELTVHPANAAARHLYEKNGFVRFGTLQMEYLYFLLFDHT